MENIFEFLLKIFPIHFQSPKHFSHLHMIRPLAYCANINLTLVGSERASFWSTSTQTTLSLVPIRIYRSMKKNHNKLLRQNLDLSQIFTWFCQYPDIDSSRILYGLINNWILIHHGFYMVVSISRYWLITDFIQYYQYPDIDS